MRAFDHPDQAAHAPQQSMRFNRIEPVKDLPVRPAKLLGALEGRGMRPDLVVNTVRNHR